MRRSNAIIDLASSSLSLIGETEPLGHFRWESIKKFLILACTFSAAAFNFDIFSKVCENVNLLDFILCEATIGVTYMFMDSFIKLYTNRYDCNRYMNPLLRGISYGRFLQTGMFVVLHASYLADSLRYLIRSFPEVPPWSICGGGNNTGCITAKDIMVGCNRNATTKFSASSAYFSYLESFSSLDRNTLTLRFFILGLVWILVFFFASVTEETIVKIFKLAFMCTSISTILIISFIFISTNNVAIKAFTQIVDFTSSSEFLLSFKHVSYAYGIGFLGVYDYGSISAYTMVDTAAVIFVIVFTILAFIRSWIIKILYLVLTECVTIDKQHGTHVLFFAIVPLATEFLYAHKLYVLYFYANVMISTLVYMTNLMYILSKFLSYEFRSVKQIYIVGLLCCVGFGFSIPVLALMTTVSQATTFTTGFDIVAAYLGGAYMAIVMWLYGLNKFCTDIQFWLGFRPARFWTITWALLPVALFCISILGIYELVQWENTIMKWAAVGWTSFTFLVVAFMNIKSIIEFLMRNNLAGLFKSHRKYGPPEPEDRKRRLYYSEYTRQRACKHNCVVIDDWFDCIHEPLQVIASSRASGTRNSSSSNDDDDSKSLERLQSEVNLFPDNIEYTDRT